MRIKLPEPTNPTDTELIEDWNKLVLRIKIPQIVTNEEPFLDCIIILDEDTYPDW